MNLKQHYQEKVVPALMDEFSITNKMAVPKITKISLNISLKEGAHDKGTLEKAAEQLGIIAGQKAKVTRARIAIANFKLRAGDPIGLAVTLRGTRMYDFMTKLLQIVLPRVRDFQGVSTKAFDKAGNYTLGMADQIVFPEIDYSKIDKIRGLEITFVNTSGNAQVARRLLTLMGMPFKKN